MNGYEPAIISWSKVPYTKSIQIWCGTKRDLKSNKKEKNKLRRRSQKRNEKTEEEKNERWKSLQVCNFYLIFQKLSKEK